PYNKCKLPSLATWKPTYLETLKVVGYTPGQAQGSALPVTFHKDRP
ncbi:10385_t:CDS:2, partial [Scutellospora calospora]